MDKPLCKNCRHFVGHRCVEQRNLAPDFVNGGYRSVQSPDFLRESGTRCGPDGHWFTALKHLNLV